MKRHANPLSGGVPSPLSTPSTKGQLLPAGLTGLVTLSKATTKYYAAAISTTTAGVMRAMRHSDQEDGEGMRPRYRSPA